MTRGYPEILFNNQIDKIKTFGKDKSVKKTSEGHIPFLTYIP